MLQRCQPVLRRTPRPFHQASYEHNQQPDGELPPVARRSENQLLELPRVLRIVLPPSQPLQINFAARSTMPRQQPQPAAAFQGDHAIWPVSLSLMNLPTQQLPALPQATYL